MADKAPDQEPSIEEILASIRQIISDDDDKPAAAAAPEPEPAAPESAPEPEPQAAAPAPAEDVLELTPSMQEEPEEEEIEIDLMDEPAPPPQMSAVDEDADIISNAARQATLSSLAKLTGHMPVNRTRGYDGTTLEDIVRELLYPMLRDWMDSNLPKMVERLVQKELEKLTRRAMDD